MVVWRLLRATLVAVAGAIITLAQLNLPKGWWQRHEALEWTAVGLLVVITVLEAAGEISLSRQDQRIRKYDQKVRITLSAVVVQIYDIVGADWPTVEVRYYRRLGRRRRLHRIGAVMAGADFDNGEPPIKIGTGFVGSAFQAEHRLAINWGAFYRAAAKAGPEMWEQRSAADRYNLSWAQLQSTADPHEGMLARPTFANNQIRGCLVVGGKITRTDLLTSKMQAIIDSAAAAIEQAGSPPQGWRRQHGR